MTATGLAIVPPRFGDRSRFRSVAGAIDERVRIDADGTALTMVLQGASRDLPVILLLGGGPGIPGSLMECLMPTPLADHFIVAYPEYRGTGLSRTGDEVAAELDTAQYLRDVEAFTAFPTKRFERDRIILMGRLFCTYLGIQAAQQHPEKYTAYVGMSQLGDGRARETAAYARMIGMDEERGDRMAEELRAFDLDDDADYERWTTSKTRDTAMHELGGGTAHEMRDVMTGIFWPSLRCTYYSQEERIRIWQGKFAAHGYAVTEQSRTWQGGSAVTHLGVPFYVLAGARDLTTYYPQQQELFEQVAAPVKGFYTFAESAHSPLHEQPHDVIRVLRADVLNGTTEHADGP